VDSQNAATGGHQDGYEVAVAIVGELSNTASSRSPHEVRPGFDRTAGHHQAGRSLLAKGDEAVRAATEAIAKQIALAAQRIAVVIENQMAEPNESTSMVLDAVEVSFGVTLVSGIEAMFTAKSESSAEVSITIKRRPTA
jgi:hypothetical protein